MTLDAQFSTPHKPVAWHVLGAGAMGCLWASALAAHSPVCLLLKDAAALDKFPGFVRLQDADGQITDTQMQATIASELRPGSIQRLLLCCKAQDADTAIQSVAHALMDKSIVVLLQNGIEFQQTLTASRPAGTVFCLSTSAGAWMREPYVITPAGRGQSWLGHLDTRLPAQSTHRALTLLSELPAAEFHIQFEPDMSTRLWLKLAVNCAINGLTVVHSCRNGELLTRPEALSQLQALCEEITHLYNHLPEAPDITGLYQTVHQVASGTADNVSSTLQDVRRGKTTELSHLNGFLVQLAQRHHLPCPLNHWLLDAVREREAACS